jgi:hypothetical protein
LTRMRGEKTHVFGQNDDFLIGGRLRTRPERNWGEMDCGRLGRDT